jgi:GT2 family glycosyltransferase
MIDQMDRSGASIVGPLSNYATVDQTVANVPYEASDTAGILEFAEQTARENRGKYTLTIALTGLCLLIDRSVVQRIGGFDPVFNPGNWEDVDLGLRAHASGFRSAIARDVFIHHYGGQGPGWNELLQANWEKFKKKWGVEVSLPSQNWLDETPHVSIELLARNREWPFCFDDSIWERPSAEVGG